MTFLNPLLLLGLAAAALPVVVHLFNLRRPQRVDFSSLAFVRALEERSMRRVRIKEWLLLALRVLAVACLVLAFARPTLTGRAGAALGPRAPSSVGVVVDNSLSMERRDGQGAYLDQARTAAAGIVEALEDGDEVFLLAATDTAVAAPYASRSAAQEALAALKAGPGAAPATQLVARAAGALAERAAYPNRAVYLISDRQASTLGDTLARALPPGVRVRLVPVGSGGQTAGRANVAVTEVHVESRIVEAGQPVHVEATLRNFGSEALPGYGASLYLEGRRVAQATADLAPQAQATIPFTLTPQERGWLAGRVATEGDAFAPDDARHFVLHVPEVRRVLLVQGAGQPAQYVQTALSQELIGERIALDVETISEEGLAGTALGGYDAVVLVGPRTLASGEREALAQYVAQGGGVLLFPGAGASVEDYNRLLGRWGGGRFDGFEGEAGGEDPVATFARVDREHPLFEGIFDDASAGTSAGGPAEERVERAEVYRAARYVPRTGTEQTLIELTTGRPFLQEIRHGRGAALVMAVAPDRQWSDLPVRGLFVPLLHRAIYYLASGASAAGEALVAGQGGALRVAGASAQAPVRLLGPEGDEYAPQQQRVFGAVLLDVGRALRTPGVYDVRQEGRLLRRVALNLDVPESDLAALDAERAAEQLSEKTGAAVHVLDPGAGSVAQALHAEQIGTEIWNVFLLLALGFLVTETVVARRWQPEAAPAAA